MTGFEYAKELVAFGTKRLNRYKRAPQVLEKLLIRVLAADVRANRLADYAVVRTTDGLDVGFKMSVDGNFFILKLMFEGVVMAK